MNSIENGLHIHGESTVQKRRKNHDYWRRTKKSFAHRFTSILVYFTVRFSYYRDSCRMSQDLTRKVSNSDSGYLCLPIECSEGFGHRILYCRRNKYVSKCLIGLCEIA